MDYTELLTGTRLLVGVGGVALEGFKNVLVLFPAEHRSPSGVGRG